MTVEPVPASSPDPSAAYLGAWLGAGLGGLVGLLLGVAAGASQGRTCTGEVDAFGDPICMGGDPASGIAFGGVLGAAIAPLVSGLFAGMMGYGEISGGSVGGAYLGAVLGLIVGIAVSAAVDDSISAATVVGVGTAAGLTLMTAGALLFWLIDVGDASGSASIPPSVELAIGPDGAVAGLSGVF